MNNAPSISSIRPNVRFPPPPPPAASDVYIMEPLTAGTLECLALGVPTSYKRVMALTCGELLQGDLGAPTGVNIEALKPLAKTDDVSVRWARARHTCGAHACTPPMYVSAVLGATSR